jgi:flagellar biosynthesis protein FliP
MDQGKLTASQAFDEGSKPMKTFLSKFAREKDVKLFVDIAKAPAQTLEQSTGSMQMAKDRLRESQQAQALEPQTKARNSRRSTIWVRQIRTHDL